MPIHEIHIMVYLFIALISGIELIIMVHNHNLYCLYSRYNYKTGALFVAEEQ